MKWNYESTQKNDEDIAVHMNDDETKAVSMITEIDGIADASAKKRRSGKTNFKRISAHRGKKRAYAAVAHSMLIAIYHILKEWIKYRDLGFDYYNQFNK